MIKHYLHEGVPHPHIGHQENMRTKDMKTNVNKKSDKNSENISGNNKKVVGKSK